MTWGRLRRTTVLPDSDYFTPVFIHQLIKGYNPTNDVLVMTFCEGVPVLEFIRENQDDPDLLRKMCNIGIRSVCKMIFEDNFLHGTPNARDVACFVVCMAFSQATCQ